MKILHISNKPIYPRLDGGCVAMAAMLKDLSAISEVHHLSFSTHKHPFDSSAYPTKLQAVLSKTDLFIDTRIKLFPAFLCWLKAENYNLKRFFTKESCGQLEAHLSINTYDVIVLESLFLASYITTIRQFSTAKVIIRTHNVEQDLWQQQAKKAKGIKRLYLFHLAKTLAREEIMLLNNACEIWSITDEDKIRLEDLGVIKKIVTVKVSITQTKKTEKISPDFFHLGSLNWQPNQESINYILQDIWPKFQQHSKSTFHVAGSFTSSHKLQEIGGMQLHGFVEDAHTFMQEHGSLIAPIQSGSGVRVKLLEAMALGIPCITTKMGAAGLNLTTEPVLIAESEDEWLYQMKRLSEDESLRINIGNQAFEYMQEHHLPSIIQTQLQHQLGI